MIKKNLLYKFSLLRYETIDYKTFFNLLSTIENNISNVILREGSIFKYIF
jgi:hypothetical protein